MAAHVGGEGSGKMKICLVGEGAQGLTHIEALREMEDVEIVSLAGYRMQLEETYGSMPAAPDIPGATTAPLPVTDTVANSPYGGAEEIFQQQVTPAPVPAELPPTNALPAGAPPLPPGGLPSGWTMEQWTHYGAEYRQQQGLD